MRNILILGAGRSASSLIRYLQNKSESENLHLTIADISLELAQRKTNKHSQSTAISLDIFDENQRKNAIEKADIVVSMPFTSTSLIGNAYSVPSVYYDPFFIISKQDRGANGLPLLSGKDELRQWIKSLKHK